MGSDGCDATLKEPLKDNFADEGLLVVRVDWECVAPVASDFFEHDATLLREGNRKASEKVVKVDPPLIEEGGERFFDFMDVALGGRFGWELVAVDMEDCVFVDRKGAALD